MKGFTLNIAAILGFIIAMVTMLMGRADLHFTPTMVHFFGIVIAVCSIALKTQWLVSQGWKGGGWTVSIWVFNIAYLILAIVQELTDTALMSASIGTFIIFTINAAIMYFGNGNVKNKTA